MISIMQGVWSRKRWEGRICGVRSIGWIVMRIMSNMRASICTLTMNESVILLIFDIFQKFCTVHL